MKRFVQYDGSIDTEGLSKFMNSHIVGSTNDVRRRLTIDKEQVKLLCRFSIETDIKKDSLKFSIPDVGIKMSEGVIPHYVAKQYEQLSDGEHWGVVTLEHALDEKEKGYIELSKFVPFQPYKVDLDFFKEYRKEFTLDEWIDVLISAMEYNPYNDSVTGFNTVERKLLFVSRLLVFVQSNLNMIELAPKGTGKSYVFSNLSKFGWMFSGGKITRAKLFYDMSKKAPGIIVNKDFVAFDEVKTIRFGDDAEMSASLKGYLEAGKFTFSNYEGTSGASVILLGNIDLTKDMLPKKESFFEDLPTIFGETALLDRFHGFIKGWNLVRINKSMILEGTCLNVEYFSEILHKLREEVSYSSIVSQMVDTPGDADTRDTNAIIRIATAYLKLLFPHIERAEDMDTADFDKYCLKPAKEMRGIIKQQMALLDPEYDPEIPDIRVKG